jgi:hypothetical protein
VISVKSHGAQPCFSAYQLIPSELRLPEGPREGNGLRAYCGTSGATDRAKFTSRRVSVAAKKS